jgi:hypothetical protein
VPDYYERKAVWSAESLARGDALRPKVQAWRAEQKQLQGG